MRTIVFVGPEVTTGPMRTTNRALLLSTEPALFHATSWYVPPLALARFGSTSVAFVAPVRLLPSWRHWKYIGSVPVTVAVSVTLPAVELVCVVADTEWNVISSVGNLTVV